MASPPSPCILVCTMDARGELCLGCHRTLEEIAGWSAASDEEKRAILARVAERAGAAPARTDSAHSTVRPEERLSEAEASSRRT